MQSIPGTALIASALVGSLIFSGAIRQRTVPQYISLTGATVFDGTGAPSCSGTTILVADGRIAGVFPDGSRPTPLGARAIDLRGRYVIPGLIDAHVHLGTSPRPAQMSVQILRAVFLGGVTAVRDMGGQLDLVRPLVALGADDTIPVPRVIMAAIMAGPGDWFSGGRGTFFASGAAPGEAPTVRRVGADSDVRAVIAAARAAGAHGIKVYNTVPASLQRRLAEEAKRQGLRAWSHLSVDPARPSDVIRSGAEVVSHADQFISELLPDALLDAPFPVRRDARVGAIARARTDTAPFMAVLALMRQRNVILDPTLYIIAAAASDTGDVNRARYADLLQFAVTMTRRAQRAGVELAAGTDHIGGSSPNLHAELQLLVDSVGLTPAQALRAATLGGARALGIADSMGTLVQGMRADLVVLGANPETDIANTQTVISVMKAGVLYERSRPMSTPPFARPASSGQREAAPVSRDARCGGQRAGSSGGVPRTSPAAELLNAISSLFMQVTQ